MDAEVTLGDVDLATVKVRSLTGVVTLISRSFLIQIISTVGLAILWGYLGPAEFGLFVVINELVAILSYFSDIGLAASLIQKKDEITLSDLRTTFTIQQVLVSLLIVVTLILSPRLISYYDLSPHGVLLLYSLLAGFFLASLKSIPSIVLERRLRFEILAGVEIVETLVFYGSLIFLAVKGQGILSYVWAVLLRGLVGTAMIYLLSPWQMGFSFSRPSLKRLLTFGIPFQLNTFIAVIKDRLLIVFLWKIIGASGVGLIGSAQTLSQKPLRFIMDNVTKVTFPGFSRLQDHPVELKKAVEKTLFFVSLATFPILAGITLLVPVIIQIYPRYAKWQPALLALALYCFNSAWAAISTPLTNVLNALGKVKINTYLMIMWTALAWILSPLMAIRYGFDGVAWATAIISFTSIIPIYIVKKITKFDLSSSVLKPLIATICMLPVTQTLARLLPANIYFLAVNITTSALVFSIAIFILVGPALIADVRHFYHALDSKK